MARIAESEIEQLNAEVALRRLIEAAGIELEPRGQDFAAACPFHEDGGRSPVVVAEKNIFHCLACNAEGGPVQWVMKKNGVSLDVAKIVKTRTPIGMGYYNDKFQIYAGSRGLVCRYLLNICGNIAFDERIFGARQLLDEINRRASEHSIPLLVWDLQAIAAQPGNQGQQRRRGRTETPVQSF